MIFSFITFALSVVGIIGFYIDNNLLLYLGAFFALIDIVISTYSDQTNNFITPILAIFIGIICCNDIVRGFAIGLCFENAILFIIGLTTILISYRTYYPKTKQRKIDNDKFVNNQNDLESYKDEGLIPRG